MYSTARPARFRLKWLGRPIGCAFLSSAMLLSASCGESRNRYPVSGTVTYNGKPVEMGTIRFEATGAVGNFAPASYAPIVQGRYSTPSESSPTDGQYRVLVSGIDVPKINKDVPPGTPWEMPQLFDPYTMTITIPPPNNTFDIVLPQKPAAK
jgi:hypothetical protein